MIIWKSRLTTNAGRGAERYENGTRLSPSLQVRTIDLDSRLLALILVLRPSRTLGIDVSLTRQIMSARLQSSSSILAFQSLLSAFSRVDGWSLRKFQGREQTNTHRALTHSLRLWRPLVGPNDDWPLALCDSASVQPEFDLEIADYVTELSCREHCHLYYRQAHTWWYLSAQQSNEAFLLRHFDSTKNPISGILLHCKA